MEFNNMNGATIAGFVLFAVGVILVIFGYNASEAPVDQISNALTGRFTDRTMWYLILGAVGIVAGALIAFSGRRRL